MIGIVLLLLTFLLSNILSYRELKQQITNSNENSVKLYMNQIDNEFDRLERNLLDFLLNDDDMMLLDAAIDTDHTVLTIQVISNKLIQMSSLFDEFDGLFVYNDKKNILVYQNRSGSSGDEKIYLGEYITNIIKNDNVKSDKNWFWAKIYSRYYFIRCIKDGNNYVGAFVRADVFLDNLNSIINNQMNYVFFCR